MDISDAYLYTDSTPGHDRFFNSDNALALRPVAVQVENGINVMFLPLFAKWESGKITDAQFLKAYRKQLPKYYKLFRKQFAKYL